MYILPFVLVPSSNTLEDQLMHLVLAEEENWNLIESTLCIGRSVSLIILTEVDTKVKSTRVIRK